MAAGMMCLLHGALLAYAPSADLARVGAAIGCLSAGQRQSQPSRGGKAMNAQSLSEADLEAVVCKLREAKAELLLIEQEEASLASSDLRDVIETLEQTILILQLRN
jgi:hypothetical protein